MSITYLRRYIGLDTKLQLSISIIRAPASLSNRYGLFKMLGFFSRKIVYKKKYMETYNELTLSDIASFYGCSIRTAQDRVREIKNYYSISHKKRILKLHLANYEGISLKDLNLMLTGLS